MELGWNQQCTKFLTNLATRDWDMVCLTEPLMADNVNLNFKAFLCVWNIPMMFYFISPVWTSMNIHITCEKPLGLFEISPQLLCLALFQARPKPSTVEAITPYDEKGNLRPQMANIRSPSCHSCHKWRCKTTVSSLQCPGGGRYRSGLLIHACKNDS